MKAIMSLEDVFKLLAEGKKVSITPHGDSEAIVEWNDVYSPKEENGAMKFEEVLPLIKEGAKAFRLGWNGKGMYVVMQKGYPDGIPCNKQTAEAWGLKEGDLFKVNPYLQIKNANGSHSMWVPSVGDIFADDWQIIR